MKSTRILPLGALAIALGLALSLGSSPGEAQSPVDARTVAAQVQAFYDQSRTFEARFYQTYYNRIYGRYVRSSGKLAFGKPGRMRFDYSRPNGKVIAADGSKLTMWEPGDSGGPGQYAQTDMARAAIPGAFSFLMGRGRLADDYTFRLLRPAAYHFEGHVLELRPRHPDPRYRRILLFVDARPGLVGVVHTIRIDDHEGDRNKIEMRSMRFDHHLPAGLFAFAPPAGARRIRM